MAFTEEQFAILMRQQQLANQIAALQNEEKRLRESFVKTLDFGGKTEGSKTFPLAKGYKLEVNLTINRTVDKAANTSEMREHLGKFGVVVDEFLVYKPEVKDGAWKKVDPTKLDDLGREMLRNLVTEKPGLPSVKIIAPEVKQ